MPANSEATHGEIIIPTEHILPTVERMALELATEYGASEQDPLFVPILEGGRQFGNDLQQAMADLGFTPEFAPIGVKTYEETAGARKPRVVVPLPDGVDFNGRIVHPIDEIHDTGDTHQFLQDYFMPEQGLYKARSVKYIAFMSRVLGIPKLQPDYVGHTLFIPDWVVGYGADDNGYGRNLPYVAISKSQPGKP